MLLRCAAPILIDLAAQVVTSPAIQAGIEIAEIRPVALPRLTETSAG